MACLVCASRQAMPGWRSLWRSALRADFAGICGLRSAVCNSLLALRALRSDKHTEHELKRFAPRPYARGGVHTAR